MLEGLRDVEASLSAAGDPVRDPTRSAGRSRDRSRAARLLWSSAIVDICGIRSSGARKSPSRCRQTRGADRGRRRRTGRAGFGQARDGRTHAAAEAAAAARSVLATAARHAGCDRGQCARIADRHSICPNIPKLLAKLDIDRDVAPVSRFRGGDNAARQRLRPSLRTAQTLCGRPQRAGARAGLVPCCVSAFRPDLAGRDRAGSRCGEDARTPTVPPSSKSSSCGASWR